MSIIPQSLLSRSELSQLGNNVLPGRKRRPHKEVPAVNRSLALHGEQVSTLFTRRNMSLTLTRRTP